MAGSNARRIVLLYGPSGDGWADRVLKALPPKWCTSFKICDGSGSVPTRLARLAALRLQGETLLAAETHAGCIVALAGGLRDIGSQFFVLNPDFRPHGESEPAWRGPANLRRRTILARMRERKLALDAAHTGLNEAAKMGRPVTEAARWLLDNAWLIDAGINQLRKNLPPAVSQPDSGGHSDICVLARNLAVTADFAVDAENIETYLQEIQKTSELTTAELWAFTSFLRVVVIEDLARKATRENESRQLRERALLWANRLAAAMRAGQSAYTRFLERLEYEPIAYRRDFTAMLGEELRDNEPALTGLWPWAEEHCGIALSDLQRLERTNASARGLLTANGYTSLRRLAHLDFAPIFEAVSVVEAELRADPGGIYPRSDFDTRDRCRREVERISLHSGISEQDVARYAVALARQSDDPLAAHVGCYLLADGIAELERNAGARIGPALRVRRWAIRNATRVYITAILLLTACFMAISVMLAREAGVHSWIVLAAFAAVASFTLSELSVEIAHALIISLLPPEPLPRMDYRDGIPAGKATLVVVPAMLTSCEAVRREVDKLEVRYLGNRNDNIFFGLLSDFIDSPVPVDAEDDELLRTAEQGIHRLNARYSGERFLLFHRPRTWSDSEQAWIGRERKRGKIEDLNAFLLGENPNLLCAGQLDAAISYVITLDSDTELPIDTAQKLIETIAHPLNQVVVDPVTRVRTSGYAIIQPLVSIALPGATATRFTRIFADAHGTDPYSRTVSDAQQDLFLEGIFHGKAIYDVAAFHRILQNRFPAETILSHDLIEGSHTGVGLASDIELFENMPLDYGSFAARQHRWIRGDWQIAPWMFRRVPLARGGTGPTPLSTISRWRILDNLRRSLVPVAAMALLLFGWLISSAPGIASLVVGLALAIPAFAPLLDRLARRVHGSVRGWQGAADDLKRAAVMIAFLPHQAWLAIDAIARVVFRRRISHRRLLEWQTAEKVQILGRHHLDTALRQMAVISVLAIALEFFLALKRGVWAPDVLFVALWIVSPLLMHWMAGPGQPEQESLSLDEQLFLRRTARKTWRYFDDHVTAATNWLPPDNSQLKFQIELAPRTSPTNIGLWLTAALTAFDFGYQTADELSARCSRTMETLRHLERCDTNLLNWYDTRTLAPLSPWYVSTVDSGNLVTALWVFAQGCRDILRAPVIGSEALRGLRDTIALVQEVCGTDQPADALRELNRMCHAPDGETGAARGSGYDLLGRLSRAAALCSTHHWDGVAGDEARYWTLRLKAQIAAWNEMAARYLSWMETLASPPDSVLQEAAPELVGLRHAALARIPSLKTMAHGRPASLDALFAQSNASARPPEIATWLDRVAAEYAVAQSTAAETVARLRSLRAAAEDLSGSMDLSRFYDPARKLFGIGYSARETKAFTSHYDLLASECRLTSLVAVAKGDVPVEHWFAMSRPWDHARHNGVLLSWSGTMFEYLMPLLFTRPVANSLLHQACLSAVNRQIEYGRQKGIPWGISESAHNVRDVREIYQYRAFGVPELAVNPEIGNDLVVAPYATMLALSVAPGKAVINLHRLAAIGMSGPMGFYESVDFRSARDGDTGAGEVVRCYMAHHQAMSLAALNNVLRRNIMQRRFHQDPRIRSVEALLCERVPIMPLPSAERTLRRATERLAAGFRLNEERFATSAAVSN